jgi:hypothetical protein
LDKGADIHAQGGDYGNALYAAYRSGNREIVKLLRRMGAFIPSPKRSDSRTLNNPAMNLRLMDSRPFDQI